MIEDVVGLVIVGLLFYMLYFLIRIPYILLIIIPSILFLRYCRNKKLRYFLLTILSLIIAFLLSMIVLMGYAYLDFEPDENYQYFIESFFSKYSPDLHYCISLATFYGLSIFYTILSSILFKIVVITKSRFRTYIKDIIKYTFFGFGFFIIIGVVIATVNKVPRDILWPIEDLHIAIPVNIVVFMIQWIIFTIPSNKRIIKDLKTYEI